MITLKQGDKAPAFTGIDQYSKQVSLADFKGKKVILYFFSEAGSPTCTIESCNLRDNYGLLLKDGFEILGVSPDNVAALKKFEVKYQLPFRMISDTSHEIMEKYGAWDQKKLFGREYMGVLRTTFIIDENGIIRKIFLKPRNKVHAEEIIEVWKSLS